MSSAELYIDDNGTYILTAFSNKVYGDYNAETGEFTSKHGSIFGPSAITAGLQGVPNIKKGVIGGHPINGHIPYDYLATMPDGYQGIIKLVADLIKQHGNKAEGLAPAA